MIDPTRPDFGDTPVSAKRASLDYELGDGNAEPIVAVVTPLLNPGPELFETARSLRAQTFQQFVWVVVNDGSTDVESVDRIRELSTTDPRMRLVELPETLGLPAARNAGISATTAPYVVLLDGDDLLEPTAIEKWLWYLETHPGHAFCKGYSIGFEGQEYLWQHGFHDAEKFLDQNLVDVTSMVRSSAFRAVGGFDESIREGLEDWDFWLRCAAHGLWGGTVPEFLNWYRRKPEEHTRWQSLTEEGQGHFQSSLRRKLPDLWRPGGFPRPEPRGVRSAPRLVRTSANALTAQSGRILLVVGDLPGGSASDGNFRFVEHLVGRAMPVTLLPTGVADASALSRFSRLTPDLLPLRNFVYPVDYLPFVEYVLVSRQFDMVCVADSEVTLSMLPRLGAILPDAWFVRLGAREKAERPAGRAPSDLHRIVQEAAASDGRDVIPISTGNGRFNAEQYYQTLIVNAERDSRRLDEQLHQMEADFFKLEQWTSEQAKAIDWLRNERDALEAQVRQLTSEPEQPE